MDEPRLNELSESEEHEREVRIVKLLLKSRKPIPKNGHVSQLEAALEWSKKLSPEELDKEDELVRRIARLEGPPGP